MNHRPPELRRPPTKSATLDQWLSYLEAIHPTEIDLGLDRVLTVLRRLIPGRSGTRIITVAGTNGKGTTIAALEIMLRSAGRSVAAYTSPHLQRFNERMRINGEDVSDPSLIAAFETVENARQSTSLTYFEFTTLAAFVLFRESNVDDWLLEVGLGGRLDAVNVLDPDLAIITAIGIDHEAFLGTDREVIGFEKAGILRVNRPAVLADDQPPASIGQQALAQKIPLYCIGQDFRLENRDGSITVSGKRGREPVFFADNGLPASSIAAAVQAMWLLEPELASATLSSALGRLHLPGRFERVRNKPTLVIDVGHNPHAAQWLAMRLPAEIGAGQLHAVYAGLADKDTQGVLSALTGLVSRWYFASLDVARGLSAEQVAERAVASGVKPHVFQCCESVPVAIEQCLAQAGEGDCILVFGSFYTVAAARDHLVNCRDWPGQP